MDAGGNGIFQSIRFWQGWAVAVTVAALFTFVANAEFPVAGHTPDYVGLIGESDAPLWVVNADLRQGVVKARAVDAKPPADGERYALWLIAGKSTMRLGPLPLHRDRAVLHLGNTARALLGHGRTLGVAVEPVAAPAREAESAAAATPDAWSWQATVVRL